jgi:sugar phosphate isomerase/epimerase
MIVHIEICDVCGHRTQRTTPFTARKGNKDVRWDVGECCMDVRFTIREHRKVDVVLTVSP